MPRPPRSRTYPADVRASVVHAAPPLLRELGQNPAPLLAASGLPARAFTDPDVPVSFTAIGRFLDQCARRTACAHFGLLLGSRMRLPQLGPLGAIMAHSPTVGTGLANGIRHIIIQDRGGAPYLHFTDARHAALGYTVYRPVRSGLAQIHETALAVLHMVLRALGGPGFKPVRVRLAHRAPADPAPYRRVFAAPVEFDAARFEIVFRRSWLDQRIAGADAQQLLLLEGLASGLEAAQREAFSLRVRRAAQSLAFTGRLTAESVCGVLALPHHTVSRRLRAEGLSLRQLINETRAEVARQLLRETDLPLSAVAAALGYSDPSAFSRAFRAWSGRAPRRWRPGARRGGGA